jgi:hypothetical protein
MRIEFESGSIRFDKFDKIGVIFRTGGGGGYSDSGAFKRLY